MRTSCIVTEGLLCVAVVNGNGQTLLFTMQKLEHLQLKQYNSLKNSVIIPKISQNNNKNKTLRCFPLISEVLMRKNIPSFNGFVFHHTYFFVINATESSLYIRQFT